MNRKSRTKISFGQVLIGTGLIFKVLQIILSAAGVAFAAATVPTLAVTCLAVGGLAVYAVERRGAIAVISVFAAVLWMVSLLTARTGGIWATASYFGAYIALSLVLYLSQRRFSKPASVIAVALLALTALYLAGILPLGAVGAAVVLCLINTAICIGLFA